MSSDQPAPAGRPTADNRPVLVGDVPVYLARNRVAVVLSIREAAVALNALTVAQHDREVLERAAPEPRHRAALDRAIERMVAALAAQVQEEDE